ncbi:MAG: hypothetical protein ACR2FY_15820 [Pirellulaceae bacterium]
MNIAQMSVGRTTPGGGAIGVLNLDGHPPAAALDEFRTHPAISGARILESPAAREMPTCLRW